MYTKCNDHCNCNQWFVDRVPGTGARGPCFRQVVFKTTFTVLSVILVYPHAV